MNKHVMAFMASVLLLVGAACADTAKGVQFYESEQYPQAYQEFVGPASSGNATAQFYLGLMYDNGKGVTQDEQQALSWYRKAADQGNADGQWNLGNMYFFGDGVTQNLQQALYWCRKAAEQGNPEFQYNLGGFYEFGDERNGMQPDIQAALHWYRKAANQGFANAQYRLGRIYGEGLGVKKDYHQALSWYRKAAAQGDTNAKASVVAMELQGPPTPVPPPSIVQGDLYMLAVGVDTYQDLSISSLEYASKDATDLSTFFRTQQGKAYRKVNVTLLRNGEATRSRILGTLDTISKNATAKDTIILSFAMHGQNAGGNYYLLTNDTRFDNLAGTALSGSRLLSTFSVIRGNTLMILDSCFSGTIARTRASTRSNPSAFVTRAVATTAGNPAIKTIITAASAEQEANEGNGLQNGYFTYAFLEGMRKLSGPGNGVKVFDVLSYTAERVPGLVRERGGKTQEPNIAAGRIPTWVIAR